MEARQTLAQRPAAMGLTLILAVSVAIGLVVTAAAVAKDFGGSNGTVSSSVQAAPHAMPLRQDNDYPVIRATHDGRSTGNSLVDPSESGAGAGAGQGFDARSVREGHGP